MATHVIGKLDSWEDADLGGNDFMNLEEGSNPVRIFSSPYQFYVVWTFDEAGKKRKIKSPVDNCPLVARGEKAQPRWYLGVLNRDQKNSPSILEIGPQIFRQIVGLSKNKKWGDPKKYDIDITKQPKGSQPLYTVTPFPHEPLTSEEKSAIKEFSSRVDFARLTEAPSPEEIREMLGLPSEDAKQKSKVSNDFDSTDDDDDFDFDDDL